MIPICLALATAGEQRPVQLTIYNQNFAVVRQSLMTELKSGVNTLTLTDVTRTLEADSVVLRDPDGKRELRVLEQNFRPNVVTPELLLSQYEGKTLQFEVIEPGGKRSLVSGKVIRSGMAAEYNPNQPYLSYNYSPPPPLIEVNGMLRFGLPGTPLFPSLTGDDVLKPTLSLVVEAAKNGAANLELTYLTGNITWEAAYNLVSPEKGDEVQLTGLVTMRNQSGKTFSEAQIQLMAGDVSKLQPAGMAGGMGSGFGGAAARSMQPPSVTQKTFDEYHLYTLGRQATLHNGEIKQVEFVRSEKIASKRIYVYSGVSIDPNRYSGWSQDNYFSQREYGSQSNPKVWVMREFENTQKNNLGIPLPKGRIRFYRKDGETLQFVGENTIDHTPQGEKVRVYTGDAFDIVGERRQTNFVYDAEKRTVEESFEIKVRNRKTEPVDVRVAEKLYRGTNWEVRTSTEKFEKKDSTSIEYLISIPANGEKIITYTAHYFW
jgi:hypothetical protein